MDGASGRASTASRTRGRDPADSTDERKEKHSRSSVLGRGSSSLLCLSGAPRVCGAGHSARGFSSLFAAGGRAMVDIRVGVGASSAGGSCKHKLA